MNEIRSEGNKDQADKQRTTEFPPPKLQSTPTAEANTKDTDGGGGDTTGKVEPPESWIELHLRKLREVGFHDWLMLLATVAIAASTITYTHYASGQLGAMRGQLAEMKSSSSDTHDLAVSAQGQAQAAKTLAQSANAQAIAATQTATDTHELALAAKNSAETGARQLSDFENSERAILQV